MGFRGSMLTAKVDMYDDVALVVLSNRAARIVTVRIEGTLNGSATVTIGGNDVFRGSYTVGDKFLIRSGDPSGEILYPYPA